MLMPKGLAACFAIALLALTVNSAWPQTTRTIRVIVPMAPGGAVDFVARLLAQQVERLQSATIMIENRPGAGSEIGTEAASRAAADGNTLLINAAGNLLIGPQLRKLNYDPLTSFEPICELVRLPDIIVVNSASSYRTLADLISAARAKPGDVTVASLGPNTDLQIEFEKLKRAADVNMTFVPYPGVAPAVNALLGGHVTAAITSYTTAAEQLKAGKLRALAATTRTRIAALPDVPTVAESGYNDYDMDVWFGLFAPAKTPQDTIARLADWFTAAVQSPEVRTKLVAQGFYPVAMCGTDFAALVRNQYDDFGRVIREANLKAE
jgi:tripartite-type tricarboxylate transporter receptor subunit TctC